MLLVGERDFAVPILFTWSVPSKVGIGEGKDLGVSIKAIRGVVPSMPMLAEVNRSAWQLAK